MAEFVVNFCAVSGDPGCVGWPSAHDSVCQMYPRVCYACDECGADDVYGEIVHADDCRAIHTPESPSVLDRTNNNA